MQLRLEPVTRKTGLAVLSLRAGTGQEGFVETVSAAWTRPHSARTGDPWPFTTARRWSVSPCTVIFGNTRLRAACGWTGCSSTPPGRAEATAEPPWHLCWPAWPEEYGPRDIYLSVVDGNTAAARLYEAFGFVFTEEEGCPRRACDASPGCTCTRVIKGKL